MGDRLFSSFNITPQEQSLYEGRAGQEIEEIANQIRQGYSSVNQLLAAEDIAKQFFEAGTGILQSTE